MMPLDLERLKLEVKRVDMAKSEMEFKIKERLEEISRLQEHIKIQEDKLKELSEKIRS